MWQFTPTHDGLERDSRTPPAMTSPDGTQTVTVTGNQISLNGSPLSSPRLTTNTAYEGVNNAGEVLAQGVVDGTDQTYIWNAGTIETLDDPNARMTQTIGVSFDGSTPITYPEQETIGDSINAKGDVVGSYASEDGVGHGFLWDHSTGQFTTIDNPLGVDTVLTNIADDGTITGYWASSPGGMIEGDDTVHWFTAINVPDNPLQQSGPPDGDWTNPANQIPNSGARNFLVDDRSINDHVVVSGTPYNGPVAGLSDEIILVSPHNLNITALEPNVFIHSGSGEDALSVQAVDGNNVLDGGTGSNFLTGGVGNHDQFYLDDRNAPSDIWSTIVNFHAGDVIDVWGMNKADWNLQWVDNDGAANAKGVTLHATSANHPEASLTMAGYSLSDMKSQMHIAYGHTPDQPGLPGSDYMQISM